MHVLIRPADLLSANEALELSQRREMFERGVRRRLSKIPIDVTFDWTLVDTSPSNAFVFFDHNGYPMSLPPRLAELGAIIEQAIVDAMSGVVRVMERSPARAQRWRARAEEYRTIAETAKSAAGRDAYLALAASCQEFAERLAEYGELVSPESGEAVGAVEADEDEPRNAA